MDAAEHIVEYKGTPLHYWLTGPESAPLMVCTHGASCDHHMFDEQLPALAKDYRVLTWDVRGHGLSRPMGTNFSIAQCVEDILAILDALNVKTATFLGQSMGGNISQEIAFHYPQRIEALIVIDSVCNTNKLTTLEKLTLSVTPALLALYPYESLRRQAAKA